MTTTPHLHPAVRARAERAHARAIAAGQAALATAADTTGKTSSDYAAALLRLAAVFVESGDFASAEPLFQECLMLDLETGREPEAAGRETLRRMVVFYRTWGRESDAQPLARRLAALEAAQFGGDTAATESPPETPSLVGELIGEFGGAATMRRSTQVWSGLVAPGILTVLGLLRCCSDRVRIHMYYYRPGPHMTVASWPAALAAATLLFSAATFLHCHYYAGIKHPIGVAYVKFGALIVGIASLFVYAWGMWGSWS